MDDKMQYITNLIDEIGSLQKEKSEIEAKIALCKKNLLRVRNANDDTKTLDRIKGNKFSVTFSKRLTVDYDVEKTSIRLKDRGASKSVIDTAIKKTYSVVNAKEFLDKLKEIGVPIKFVKKHIVSSSYVDKEGLQELFDLNVITLSDLEGCYDAKVTSVVTVKEL